MFARTTYNYGVIFKEEPHNIAIDELIRGEMAAIDAYRKVEQEVYDEGEFRRLKQIEFDHIQALNYWKNEARRYGNIPEKRKKIWGVFVEAIVSLAKSFGIKPALKTLFRGELLGIKNYNKMLRSKLLSKQQKKKIQSEFIPRQLNHISYFKQKYNFF